MRNITLLGTAAAALTATMLLASPASAACRQVCGPGGHCREQCSPRGDLSRRGDLSMRRNMYMRERDRDYDGYRDRDYGYRDRDYYGDYGPGIRLHVPGVGIELR